MRHVKLILCGFMCLHGLESAITTSVNHQQKSKASTSQQFQMEKVKKENWLSSFFNNVKGKTNKALSEMTISPSTQTTVSPSSAVPTVQTVSPSSAVPTAQAQTTVS